MKNKNAKAPAKITGWPDSFTESKSQSGNPSVFTNVEDAKAWIEKNYKDKNIKNYAVSVLVRNMKEHVAAKLMSDLYLLPVTYSNTIYTLKQSAVDKIDRLKAVEEAREKAKKGETK